MSRDSAYADGLLLGHNLHQLVSSSRLTLSYNHEDRTSVWKVPGLVRPTFPFRMKCLPKPGHSLPLPIRRDLQSPRQSDRSLTLKMESGRPRDGWHYSAGRHDLSCLARSLQVQPCACRIGFAVLRSAS